MQQSKVQEPKIPKGLDPSVYAKLVESFEFYNFHPSPRHGRNFKPRTSDIFISTYPKCGTTWVTQICHQLRSNGDMNFKEIAEVAPWDIMALMLNQDLDADQKFSPRLFKSHELVRDVAKGGKYVVVVRNQHDAFASLYKFHLPIAKTSFEDCSMEQYVEVPNQYGYLAGWYAEWYAAWKRGDVEVCWVFYEDLKSNTAREVTRIAEFMEISKDVIESRVEVALVNSSIEFMSKHGDKFNEGLVLDALDQEEHTTGEHGYAKKVAKGEIAAGENLPKIVRDRLEAQWKECMEDTLGFVTYEEFKAAVQS